MSPLPIPTRLPELTQIQLPTPFPVGTVNVYLIEGEPLTLVDCGVNSPETLTLLTESLAQLNHRLDDIERVIISHHHVDHLGAIQHLVEASSPEVVAHAYTVPYLEKPHAARLRNRSFTDVAFRQAGVPQAVIDLMDEQDTYYESLMTVASVGQVVDEGDVLALGGRDWQVYHTPGHAGGLICLFQPDSGVLLSSDHLLGHISSNPLIEAPEPGHKRPRRLVEYIAHLKRIAALTPTIAYTGHGDPIEDVGELIAKRLDLNERRTEKVARFFEHEQRHTLYDLSRLVFPTATDSEAYLTLSEVLGHIDILEVAGRLEREMSSQGVVYWKQTG
jgi:glyoxylase-like metal-dependent hydrolase (beta-lactamase superfamily II)